MKNNLERGQRPARSGLKRLADAKDVLVWIGE